MIDPNTGIEMFESDDIIKYLFKIYGSVTVPKVIEANNAWVAISAGIGLTLGRFGRGLNYRFSDPPPLPLNVWLYESSPFGKIVKEALTELELEHTVIYTPRGSPNRQRMLDQVGRFQVPYLEDPNTGVKLFESQAIVEYLEKQYGANAQVSYL